VGASRRPDSGARGPGPRRLRAAHPRAVAFRAGPCASARCGGSASRRREPACGARHGRLAGAPRHQPRR